MMKDAKKETRKNFHNSFKHFNNFFYKIKETFK